MMLMRGSNEGTPQINESMSVAKDRSNFINERAKVSFVAAAQTAQEHVTNGTVIGGPLSGCNDISYTSC
jgi:hypothetical protein